MTEHYFLYPFGIDGTLNAIPNPTQISGTVSYQSGFPIGYQLVNTAPGYLSIPRDQFNQLMFDATSAIQQIQQTGFPSWITSSANGGTSFPYALGAEVWYSGVPYRSLINNNTDTPPSTNWVVIGYNPSLYFNWAIDTGSANTYVIAPNPAVTSLAAGTVVQMQPQFANTGACTLNVNGLGAVSIKTLQNQDPTANMIIPAGMFQFEYNAVTGFWVLQNPALGTAAYNNIGTTTGTIPVLISTGLPVISGQNLTNLPAQFSTTNTASGKIVLGAITIQWGFHPSSGGASPTITFGTSFSSAPYSITFGGQGNGAGIWYTGTPSASSFTTYTGSTDEQGGASAYSFYWIAIGPT